MNNIRIAYICHYSTDFVRRRLSLRSFLCENLVRRMCGISRLGYVDFGTWNADFIDTIDSIGKYDIYVFVHHMGMKKKQECFQEGHVHYSFLKEGRGLFNRLVWSIAPQMEKKHYSRVAKQIKNEVEQINPDLVIVCGAENPIYSPSALLFIDKPVFVILQTLLNSKKRVEMNIGSEYRKRLENTIFSQINYFGTFNLDDSYYIHSINRHANCFRLYYPSSEQKIERIKETPKYDFVFFSNGLSKYKGTEDALRGFAFVHRKHPNCNMIFIGSCENAYMEVLNDIIKENDIRNNVVFHDRFPQKSDMLKQVLGSRVAVLPGITAPLNSTVRECMFMSVPVIVYSNSVTSVINKMQTCVLTAEMENVNDLGMKMLYAYEHPCEMEKMSECAKDYAVNNFSKQSVGKNLMKIIDAVLENYYKGGIIPNELLLT